MIPKVIHYCWFGRNQLPASALKCIESWKKYLPEYEIKEWNEDNFDVNIIPYTAEAYRLKKYAFVSDYARFWILYKYGGLYFDTDVEVIKPMDDIIARGPFMGCENMAQPGATPTQLGVAPGLGLGVNPGLGLGVNPGLGLGVNPGLGLYREILDSYKSRHYQLPDGTCSKETVVTITTEILCRKGLKNINEPQEINGVWIYPVDYFCPLSRSTGIMNITKNTYSIHLYDGTWLSPKQKLASKIKLHFGDKVFEFLCKIQRLFR